MGVAGVTHRQRKILDRNRSAIIICIPLLIACINNIYLVIPIIGGFFIGMLLLLGALVALIMSAGALFLGNSGWLHVVIWTLFTLYGVALVVVSSTLSVIFKLALYEYAKTGTIPAGFSPELVQGAIKKK